MVLIYSLNLSVDFSAQCSDCFENAQKINFLEETEPPTQDVHTLPFSTCRIMNTSFGMLTT